ncbi:MAG: hypothetical protein Q9P44_15105 [Anaerolineae bacterium]|nr:hypothetical protein [Anaerolineae bacterium]
MTTLLLKNVRPMGKDTVDVLVDAGKIQQMQANIASPANALILDGHNHLLLSGLVNAHAQQGDD